MMGVIWIGAACMGVVWPHITLYVIAVLMGWGFLVFGIIDIVNSMRNRSLPYWWANLIRASSPSAWASCASATRRTPRRAGHPPRHPRHRFGASRSSVPSPPRHAVRHREPLKSHAAMSPAGEPRCERSPTRWPPGAPGPVVLGDEIMDLSHPGGRPANDHERTAGPRLPRPRAGPRRGGRSGGPPRPVGGPAARTGARPPRHLAMA